MHITNHDNSCRQRRFIALEIETTHSLRSLDILLCRNSDGTLPTKWFQKPTSSTRYYLSQHPNITINLKTRTLNLTAEENRKGILDKVKDFLVQNCYPRKLINKILQCTTSRKSKILMPQDFQEPQILRHERFLSKRLIYEMLYIYHK